MSLPLLARLRAEWAPSIPRELLAGAVATFALIPEVIAFSFVAGVDPSVGLFASFVISIVIAVFGGRPAMVSAAAGSVALVAAPLVAAHGLPYLFAAGLLAGALQIVFGLCKLGVLMRFVSSSVRTGFVNALSPSHALRQLYDEGGSQYDPALVAAFVKTVGIYPVGTLVLLESGHLGVVEQLNPANMLAPTVRVFYHTGRRQYLTTPAEVDLSRKVGNHYGQIVRAETFERWGISPLRWQPA